MNGGLIFARRSRFASEFFALWWRGRCGKKDQLPLWATLFASWSAASDGAYDFDSSLFDRYAVAHNKRGALHVLQRDAARIRAQSGITAFDGGSFRETGRLLEKPLELPHVLLLPSAPVASPARPVVEWSQLSPWTSCPWRGPHGPCWRACPSHASHLGLALARMLVDSDRRARRPRGAGVGARGVW